MDQDKHSERSEEIESELPIVNQLQPEHPKEAPLDFSELPIIPRIDLGLALSADAEVNDDEFSGGESIDESRVGESEPELTTRSLVPAETDDVSEVQNVSFYR